MKMTNTKLLWWARLIYGFVALNAFVGAMMGKTVLLTAVGSADDVHPPIALLDHLLQSSQTRQQCQKWAQRVDFDHALQQTCQAIIHL